jgi:mRNA-degrading endonuclease YafQ of YafQ-DinJ toxin-antitoxin module
MGKKEREDDSTKEFKKSLKAVPKPSKKAKEKINKITKLLSKNDKI